MRHHDPAMRRAFTIIELLVVISIIGILIGLTMPVLSTVQRQARKVGCASNLRQIGIAITQYQYENKQVMPTARYMPPPFLSSDLSPPIDEALSHYLPARRDQPNPIYHCPGDFDSVFVLAGVSYQYETSLSGRNLVTGGASGWGRRTQTLSDIVVMRDFDGGDFATTTYGTITVPFFHTRRNLLFADGHVGNI
jgi:prepilin-type N-terminal cleavage/methylation domain-containing protein/prepilin-type processing-associated H-X9-DG protein